MLLTFEVHKKEVICGLCTVANNLTPNPQVYSDAGHRKEPLAHPNRVLSYLKYSRI